MTSEEIRLKSVPWTNRDVWLGVVAMFVLMLLLAVGVFLVPDIEVGLLLTVGELILLLPIWWLAVRKYDSSWAKLGLRGFGPESIGVGCGLMILSWLFNLAYSLILAQFDIQMQPDYSVLFAGDNAPWWIFVAGALVAPFVEEIIFRGFIFAGLRNTHGWKKAALISSACFAIIHMQPATLIPIFILGFIFAYLYQRYESIWPAVLMHMSTNAIALGGAYLLSRFPQLF